MEIILSFRQMQPWHCIAIIALTVGIFIYGTFLDKIDDESDLSLQQLGILTKKSADSSEIAAGKKSDLDRSGQETLAEKIIWLQCSDSNSVKLHQNVLEGKWFLGNLLQEIIASQNLKNQIFSAFQSELHNLNEASILESLISLIPNSEKQLNIICRGHSQKAADLLAEMILRYYPKALALEKMDAPMLPSLKEALDEMAELKKEAGDLKIIIHQELKEAPEDSIEVMAIQSEILQIDQDIEELKGHLIQIDSIHRKKLNPQEYLKITPISDFGTVKELSDVLNQLKSLSKDSLLNDFTRKEVENKILSTSQKLESEVIDAISTLKSEVSSLISRKKELQKSAIDQMEKHRTSIVKKPAVSKLEDIRKKLALIKSDFDQKQLVWMTAKKSFSLIPKPN